MKEMKTKYISIILMALGLASCSVESPFQGDQNTGEGFLSKNALELTLNIDETIKGSRAAFNNINTNDFNVKIIGESGNIKEFNMADMPEVVTLTAGTYKVEVRYNDDLEAAWNNPHFKGESSNFTVKANEITTDLEPIICSLKNVMVSVVLDGELLQHVDGSPEIEVWVNTGKALTYTSEHYSSSNPIPGYFQHSGVCTLTAQFKGNVDGVDISEVKTLENVEAGNHYRLTFYRHSYQGEDHGGITPGVLVDAKVDVNNVATNVDVEEDKVLEDVSFPKEDPEEEEKPGITDPKDPDQPDVPENNTGITVELGDGSTVSFDKENIIDATTKIIMIITSENGLKEFKIKVETDSDDDTLNGMELDLINTGDQVETLRGMHLLTDTQESLLNEKYVRIDISTFMEILAGIEGTHIFKMTLSENDEPSEDNEYVKTLILKVVNK